MVETCYRLSSRKMDGRSERDKLGRRRSTKLITRPSSDARPLQFIAQIVELCLQHDFVARVNLRQPILVTSAAQQRATCV